MSKTYPTDGLRWSVEVCEDFNGKSVLFICIHHGFSDAMGMFSLISYMNNRATDYSIPVMRKTSIWNKISVFLFFPILFFVYGKKATS